MIQLEVNFGIAAVLTTTVFKQTQDLQFTLFHQVHMFLGFLLDSIITHFLSLVTLMMYKYHPTIINFPFLIIATMLISHRIHMKSIMEYTSTYATGVQIIIDGVMRDGTRYGSDRNLDITQWITSPGWHTIELTSSQLGRINASVYIKSFVGA